MKRAIGSVGVLFLLGASLAAAQSATGNGGQMKNPAPTPSSRPVMAGDASVMNASTKQAGASSAMAMSGDPAAESALQKMENELAQAMKARDTAPFTKYLDDNVVAWGPGWKASSKADVLQSIKSDTCTVNSVANSDFAYKWISPDAVLVTYTSKVDQTCQGKAAIGLEYDSSLWQKKGGIWLSTFHQGTAAQPAA